MTTATLPTLWAGPDETTIISQSFTVGDAPTAPASVTLVVTDPQGGQITYTLGAFRTDTGCGTNTTTTVTDSHAVAGDIYKNISGGSIPAHAIITAVNVGVGYTISAAATATASGLTFTLTNLANPILGSYAFTLPLLIPGLWSYVWLSPGVDVETFAGTVTATPTTINRWYTSLEGLKSRLKITDMMDDDQLLIALAGATGAVERYTGRYFWRQAATQVFRSKDVEILHVPDLVSVTTLHVDTHGAGVYDQVWAPTDYRLEPANALTENGEPWPYTRIRAMITGGGHYWWPYVFPLSNPDRIQITGVFGWPAVPALIEQVTLQLAQDAFKLKDTGPGGVEGATDWGVTKIGGSPILKDMLSTYMRGSSKVGV